MDIIKGRLKELRKVMAAEGIDFYMIPTADFHSSEYVSDYFKVREYFSGFTGSSATLLIWQEGAGLWTDGRYFIQAQEQLFGTGITLFRMQEEGVPTLEEFLLKEMKAGQTLGFDGRVVTAAEGKRLEKKLTDIRIEYGKDLAEQIWKDRPFMPAGEVRVLPQELTGQATAKKLIEVRKKMREEGAEGLLLTKLDDLMWLFNIRGCDVECNQVALSYGYITDSTVTCFIQKKALGEAAKYFQEQKIEVREYREIFSYIKDLPQGKKVFADDRYCSYALYKVLSERQEPVEGKNPTELLKAVKNPVELRNMEEIYLKDSVAVTKFIYWLKTHIGKEEISEISAADYLEGLRRQIPEFLEPSFPTIAGYKENAAMMHYEATPESFRQLKPEGMLLVDSGGQYMGGTTDITRTIVLGPITEEEKKHYTLVAAGMLQLSNTTWLHGCTGRNLDIMARQPLWNIGLDYKCGTGHGVGYILNVHEGPQNLRWRFNPDMTEAVIEEGMNVTNEPGVYVEGSHGIRIENVMVAKNGRKNEYGQFMYFDTLTYIPLDMEAVDEKYLTKEQKGYLTEYHKKVYEKLSPFLNEEENQWLKRTCNIDF